MAEATPEERAGSPVPRETYTLGYNPAGQQNQMLRRAANFAGFLLPNLRPGMSLLDCGCGSGSITVGLAEAVAPGAVVGIDIAASQVEAARALAAERGLMNTRFEVGNVYELPFPNASFDAAFANTLLVHLREPVRALQEIRRVLKPGGVLGIGDPDPGMSLMEPTSPLLERWRALRRLAIAHNRGVESFWPRHHRRLLLDVGFVRAEAFAYALSRGTGETIQLIAAAYVAGTHEPAFTETAIKNGWTDTAELEAMAAELRAWGERPDAFQIETICQAVGWVPEAE